MRKHRSANPKIVVLGSQVREVPSPIPGRPAMPEVIPAKAAGADLHWVDAAAKKRCDGDKKKALPGDLRIVHSFRGMDARMANEARADHRRITRKREEFLAAKLGRAENQGG